ncbi:MAG: hypothetical protein WED04_02600 [Promethearchaeati archaeon SRVP18_Atabeyarchaeia-1]
MKKSLLITFAALTILLVVSVTSYTSSAADGNKLYGAPSPAYTKVGVKVGDWADYSVSSNPNFPADGIHLWFTAISGTMVTFSWRTHFINETVSTTTGTENISRHGSFAYFWLVCPDLGTGDQLAFNNPYTINGTSSMSTGGEVRSVSHFNISHSDILYFPGVDYLDIYWDQATGLGVLSTHHEAAGWYNYTLTGTSLWGQGIPVAFFVLGVGAAAVLIAISLIVLPRRAAKRMATKPKDLPSAGK